MSTIPVKITITNYGTRRLNIHRDTSFEQFQQNVKELFGIQNGLDWVYVDEENDVVTFSTHQEFRDALSVWNESKILRLNATPRSTIQRVEERHQPTASEQVPNACPFARLSCSSENRGCFASFPARIGVTLALFFAIFSHPFLTLIGLGSLMMVTRHHYPATYEKLSLHARRHWRKVAMAYGVYMLFNCKLCTLLFAVPIGLLVIRKIKRCHNAQNGECCYVKARDAVKNFLATHNINCCESFDKIVNFGQTVASVPQTQAPQRQDQPQELPKDLQPSAPPLSSLYPSANELITEEPVVLPQRVESVPFEKELETLSTMGFDNKKLNEHLLRNFNGNLDRVVTSLLQLSSMQ